MSTSPDYTVLERLSALVAALPTAGATGTPLANARALFDEILFKLTTTERDRAWAEWISAKPKVIPAFGHGQPPAPPLWVVVLAGERPGKLATGLRTHHRRTVGTLTYEVVGVGQWTQGVQLQIYVANPEAVRWHYAIAQSLLYRVAIDAVKAREVSSASPQYGGEFRVDDRMMPVSENAALCARLLEWNFSYEQEGFVPVTPPPDDVDVTATPVTV